MGASHRTGGARTLVFSQRRLARPVWRAWQFEFEDVVAAIEDADLLAPAGRSRHLAVHWTHRAVNQARRAAGRPRRGQVFAEPMLPRQTLDRDYDLFFCVIDFPWQLAYLEALPDWRARCRTAVCYLAEVWTPWLEMQAQYLSILQDFDQVFAINARVLEALARLSGRPCHPMAPAVDAFAFCPYPGPPPRSIAWYSYGRRSPAVHEQLLELARRERRLYLYDTIVGGTMPDAAEHRHLLAELVGRAEYVVCHRVSDSPERFDRTGGEDALSTRYFEAAGGGAVVVGSAPDCPEYGQAFDWPDATVPASYDGHDVLDVLRALDNDPERVARARWRNLTGTLRRHDWAYRWCDVLSLAGLEPTPSALARITRLRELAEHVDAACAADGVVAELAVGAGAGPRRNAGA